MDEFDPGAPKAGEPDGRPWWIRPPSGFTLVVVILGAIAFVVLLVLYGPLNLLS